MHGSGKKKTRKLASLFPVKVGETDFLQLDPIMQVPAFLESFRWSNLYALLALVQSLCWLCISIIICFAFVSLTPVSEMYKMIHWLHLLGWIFHYKLGNSEVNIRIFGKHSLFWVLESFPGDSRYIKRTCLQSQRIKTTTNGNSLLRSLLETMLRILQKKITTERYNHAENLRYQISELSESYPLFLNQKTKSNYA